MSENRKWITPLAVGAVGCSVILCGTTIATAYLEFHYAARTLHFRNLPPIAEGFKSVYLAGWSLPVLVGVIGFLTLAGKLGKTATACWISALALAHFAWFCFWILALYLANQTFLA